jgi:hypothetical protein
VDQRAELIATLRAEAIALLEANQRGRAGAQRMILAAFALVTATLLVGIAARTDDVAIPLPAALLLLLSAALQQYADVTVLGAARAALETRLARELGGQALAYETAVAPIRKRPPLVGSVRLLQAVAVLVLAASVVTGGVAAFDGQPLAVTLGFCVATAAGLLTLALSYRDMCRSWPVASAALRPLADPDGG